MRLFPGDIFKIGNQSVIRMQPLVAPVLHEINAYVHYFFVPYRLLWGGWEDFITGGSNGADASTLPLWSPTAPQNEGSLWDYLGFPTGIVPTASSAPVMFPLNAYNLIFNEYYRDENLQAESPLNATGLKTRNWEKDYFTSSLPWQQRGVAPALPISGVTKAIWPNAVPAGSFAMQGSYVAPNYAPFNADTKALLQANTVDLSSATTFNVSDLRLAFQIQRWMERNARAGARYTESLQAHFGVSPVMSGYNVPSTSEDLSPCYCVWCCRHRRLTQRVLKVIWQVMVCLPRPPFVVNTVLQSMALSWAFCLSCRALCINRAWIVSGCAVLVMISISQSLLTSRSRLYLIASCMQRQLSTNKAIFGYQGRYDEMRTKRNMVCGQMRSTFDYWHLGRIFSSQPALSRVLFSVFRTNVFLPLLRAGFIVQFANLIKAWRPMPIQSDPGLIDHN